MGAKNDSDGLSSRDPALVRSTGWLRAALYDEVRLKLGMRFEEACTQPAVERVEARNALFFMDKAKLARALCGKQGAALLHELNERLRVFGRAERARDKERARSA